MRVRDGLNSFSARRSVFYGSSSALFVKISSKRLKIEGQRGMDELRKRLALRSGPLISIAFDPRGYGDCFYTATAYHVYHLGLNQKNVKETCFQAPRKLSD